MSDMLVVWKMNRKRCMYSEMERIGLYEVESGMFFVAGFFVKNPSRVLRSSNQKFLKKIDVSSSAPPKRKICSNQTTIFYRTDLIGNRTQKYGPSPPSFPLPISPNITPPPTNHTTTLTHILYPLTQTLPTPFWGDWTYSFSCWWQFAELKDAGRNDLQKKVRSTNSFLQRDMSNPLTVEN